jgi:hypothetical protein
MFPSACVRGMRIVPALLVVQAVTFALSPL